MMDTSNPQPKPYKSVVTTPKEEEVLTSEGNASLSLEIPKDNGEYDPSRYIVSAIHPKPEVLLPTSVDVNVVRENGPSQWLDDHADLEEDLDNLRFF